jgi:hypothetical protein
MSPLRSTQIGAWLEALAFGIFAVTHAVIASRTGATGYLAIAASMGILSVLAMWRALALRGRESATLSRRTVIAHGAFAAVSIVLLLSGIYMNIAM